jgi:uncharacterized protein
MTSPTIPAIPAPDELRSLRIPSFASWLFVLLTFASAAVPARAEKVEQLKPQGYVNDFAGVLGPQARSQINALCAEVDQKAHVQIAVVAIRSLEGDTPQDFANRLFKQWGVGYKPDDRGVLILLAVSDRKYWVEVGYGLEPILPDGKVGGFGREMVPLVRQSDYGGAMMLLTSRIAEVVVRDRGESLSQPIARPLAHQPAFRLPLWLIVMFGWFGIRLLFSLFNRPDPRHLGSRDRQGGGWFSGGLIGGGLWGGGGFGGGGGGGGGFGGFGGGSSGGGGAGGSW